MKLGQVEVNLTNIPGCVECSEVLDLIFGCARLGESAYRFRLNYFPMPDEPLRLIWKLDPNSFYTQENMDNTCMEISPDITVKVTCAEYDGVKFGFDLVLIQHPPDPGGVYFELDPAMFYVLE